MKRHWPVIAVKGIVFAGIFIGLCFSVRELWNWLMPAIFSLPRISLGQALGLMLLSRILVGGFPGWAGRRRGWARHHKRRWARMTPEEREKFRQGLQRGCGEPAG